tara:strand:- start:4564 stop:5940 length:1377 start_codon:yes stop_codon:yes gene_type:complete
MSFVNVLSNDLYEDEYRKSIDEIWSRLNQFQTGNALFSNADDKIFYLSNISDKFQCLTYEKNLSRPIIDFVTQQSLELFYKAPFFSDFGLWYTINLLKSSNDDIKCPSFEMIEKIVSPTRKKEVIKFVSQASGCEITRHALEEAFVSTGLSGKFFVEDSKIENPTIEIKNAFSFDVETFNEFFIKSNSWDHSFAKVIIIDGVIESVAEIHHILEFASKNTDPMVIVSQGYADEVLQTLFVNMQRKALNIFPVKLLKDEKSINSFVDMSVVCDTDPVSYLKGNLISSIDYSEIKLVDRVEIKPSKIIFINNTKTAQIHHHLNRVKKNAEAKRKNLDPFSLELFDRTMQYRMKALSGRSIHFTPSKNTSDSEIRKTKINIDAAFRTIPIARDFGMFSIKDFAAAHDKKENPIIIEGLEKFFNRVKKIPAGSFINCMRVCHNSALLIKNTSGALINEPVKK